MWRLDATVPDRDKKHPRILFFFPSFTFYFILDDPLILRLADVRLRLTIFLCCCCRINYIFIHSFFHVHRRRSKGVERMKQMYKFFRRFNYCQFFLKKLITIFFFKISFSSSSVVSIITCRYKSKSLAIY